MFDEKQYHMDFNLRLKKDNRELTLGVLHELAKNEYQPQMVAKQENTRAETIPSAGYYLTGLLRANGYDTILGTKCDNEFLSRISSADPFAISQRRSSGIRDVKGSIPRQMLPAAWQSSQ